MINSSVFPQQISGRLSALESETFPSRRYRTFEIDLFFQTS